ncbi:hypothetical protein R4Z10_17860 [Niallia sp. XMNu-256]|uniref:hypothetical protein n=1 Tax=Niallia sp. XMNu-256 TaxID=3082444 RepID=UPI0030CB9AF2
MTRVRIRLSFGQNREQEMTRVRIRHSFGLNREQEVDRSPNCSLIRTEPGARG